MSCDNYGVALDLLGAVSMHPRSHHIHEAISYFLGEEIPECNCRLCSKVAEASRAAQESHRLRAAAGGAK